MGWVHRVIVAAVFGLSLQAMADGGINVQCIDDNEGALITLNGVAQGACPLRVFIPAGEYRLRAQKAEGPDHERVFEQSITLRSRDILRVRVELSAPQLTPSAVKRQAELAKQQQQQQAKDDIAAANGGDMAAIERVIGRYRSGEGLSKSETKAKEWEARLLTLQQAQQQALEAQQKAYADTILRLAEEGAANANPQHIDAARMYEMARLLRAGEGVAQNTQQAAQWEQKARAIEADLLAQQKRVQRVENFWALDNTITRMMQKEMSGFDDSLVVTFSPVSVLALLGATTIDVVILPFRATAYMVLKKQAEGHAAAWHEPDSLMGRAYAANTLTADAP